MLPRYRIKTQHMAMSRWMGPENFWSMLVTLSATFIKINRKVRQGLEHMRSRSCIRGKIASSATRETRADAATSSNLRTGSSALAPTTGKKAIGLQRTCHRWAKPLLLQKCPNLLILMTTPNFQDWSKTTPSTLPQNWCIMRLRQWETLTMPFHGIWSSIFKENLWVVSTWPPRRSISYRRTIITYQSTIVALVLTATLQGLPEVIIFKHSALLTIRHRWVICGGLLSDKEGI